jgi:hypothetical protein
VTPTSPARFTFEPHVARAVFDDLLTASGVPVYYSTRLSTVTRAGSRITELAADNGQVFRAPMFIDCSYEGDLMAKAGVQYMLGREANARFGETLNGVRAETPKHQFTVPVDPFVKRGDPASGLLPFVQAGDGGEPGEADRRIQAYNFRLCLTKRADNKRAIEPPPGYDARRYELLGRYFEALVGANQAPSLQQFLKFDMVTPEKTDINNNGPFSTDFIGANYDYPDGDYPTRAHLARARKLHSRLSHFPGE